MSLNLCELSMASLPVSPNAGDMVPERDIASVSVSLHERGVSSVLISLYKEGVPVSLGEGGMASMPISPNESCPLFQSLTIKEVWLLCLLVDSGMSSGLAVLV